MRALLVVLLLSLVPTVALADEPRVIRLPGWEVQGRRQVPFAVFVARSRVRYRAPELTPPRPPTDAIIESASRPPL